MKTPLSSLASRSTFYQFMFWGNIVSGALLLLVTLLLAGQQDPGNMGNIGLVFFALPSYLFILIDLVVIPAYLIKRLHRKDRSDITVQLLSFALFLLIIAYIAWGGGAGS